MHLLGDLEYLLELLWYVFSPYVLPGVIFTERTKENTLCTIISIWSMQIGVLQNKM